MRRSFKILLQSLIFLHACINIWLLEFERVKYESKQLRIMGLVLLFNKFYSINLDRWMMTDAPETSNHSLPVLPFPLKLTMMFFWNSLERCYNNLLLLI